MTGSVMNRGARTVTFWMVELRLKDGSGAVVKADWVLHEVSEKGDEVSLSFRKFWRKKLQGE